MPHLNSVVLCGSNRIFEPTPRPVGGRVLLLSPLHGYTDMEPDHPVVYSRDGEDDEDSTPVVSEEVVRWMTEGTSPHMAPRSDCG